MKKPKKALELRVVLDTNAIFTGSASDLFKKDILDRIQRHQSHPDLRLSWYVPQIVVDERRHQMRKKASELFPAIERLEKLLGHNLAITPEILHGRIDDVIERNGREADVRVLKLDASAVNWESLIQKAVYRLPPFDDGEKEKGFRDALIMETFRQFVDECPSSLQVCRIALVTGDERLRQACMELGFAKNVNIFASLEDLESHVNVLGSQVAEALIAEVLEPATKMFFETNNKETLYYTENVATSIKEQFKEELDSKPADATRVQQTHWWIPKPGFVSKTGQRIHWKTTIQVDIKAYGYKSNSYLTSLLSGQVNQERGIFGLNQPAFPTLGQERGIFGTQPVFSGLSQQQQFDVPITSTPTEEVVGQGASKFDVFWSVTITTKKKLINPKIEKIEVVQRAWKQ